MKIPRRERIGWKLIGVIRRLCGIRPLRVISKNEQSSIFRFSSAAIATRGISSQVDRERIIRGIMQRFRGMLDSEVKALSISDLEALRDEILKDPKRE